jgi:hypothetical protein
MSKGAPPAGLLQCGEDLFALAEGLNGDVL